ncbi:hypothetical protein [Devosia salina]|uniref:Transcription elongation factor GreA/GreB C-terminal domain-containing protein n=1 Tax=Devosia salina TaxID=2860336 RepID=A0ABX8WF50_9HYPH|nr:hypothetical protein [Devosia salina]QYO76621.1 hypothetical protein K1X15_18890 [Devosia salina]
MLHQGMNPNFCVTAVTCITPVEFERLETMMSTMTGSRQPLANLLRRKLAASVVMLPSDISSNIARIGKRVTFSVDGAKAISRHLVWTESTVSEGELPCTVTTGLALLGIGKGQSISFADERGELRTALVADVVCAEPPSDGTPKPAASASKRRDTLRNRLKSRMRQWHHQRAIMALQCLNGALLNDVGIARNDIPHIAARVVGLNVSNR